MPVENIRRTKILSVGNTNILSATKYIIPLYQRAFAWEYTEILQMLEDIENFTTDNYYLGTLIVDKRKDGKYEVIDGQQRLTALYLLLTALEIPFGDEAVSFEYRQKSDETLARLGKVEQIDWRQNADAGILSGFDVISKAISGNSERVSKIKRQLRKVNLVRVIVPPNTDLNKYFEIMNNRGEQLEQQDIVKSRLIELIRGKDERDAFARIWEACSEMSGYVQMHFGKAEREHYFGWNWQQNNIDNYYLSSNNTDQTERRSISEIADSVDITQTDADTEDKPDEDNSRFESFITFRHFLLHVLKIFETEEMGEYNSETDWSGELIDDKKLIWRFFEAFPRKQRGVSDLVQRFGLCLLQCRFLFDNFMLKREFSGDDTDGKWSLKTLKTTRQKKYGNLSAYYTDVKDGTDSRMLQSMLRVTYTSPLVMHWVTDFLAWLYFNGNDYKPSEAAYRLEIFAQNEVRANYLDEGNNSAGLKTHHIVFNYLDYLLWQETKQADFQFEFRNSVEHWYPQNPIDSNVRWGDEALHHFGNLCIVSSGLNSKFSNNLPLAKKANFRNGIERQSLKLRVMADETTGADAWTEETSIAHGERMIAKLEKAVHMG